MRAVPGGGLLAAARRGGVQRDDLLRTWPEVREEAFDAATRDDPEGLLVALHDLGFIKKPSKLDAEQTLQVRRFLEALCRRSLPEPR